MLENNISTGLNSPRDFIRTQRVLVWTWLMGRPDVIAFPIAALSTLLLVAMSFWIWSIPGALSEAAVSQDGLFVEGHWWSLWTALFAHADIAHLLSNVMMFFIFGLLLNGYFGFLVFPVFPLILGGLTNFLVVMESPPTLRLLGMSGVVFWMGGFWLTMYFYLSRHLSVAQRILRTFGITLILFVPSEAFDPQVSYRAHFIGFLLGLVSAGIYFQLQKSKFRAAEYFEEVSDNISEAGDLLPEQE